MWTPADSLKVLVPEEFSEEQRMIASMTEEFVNDQIAPLSNDIDAMKPGLMRELLQKTAELGLLSADVPEQWGGMGLDMSSSVLIAEKIAAGGASFSITHADHTALGTLPIVLFGNQDQKDRYLPGLASGEKIGAYALTEGSSGSDALAARTKAKLSADGKHYVLNGSKQFITNADTADVLVTYAQVDGDKFTAFILDKDAPGVSLGPEEKKTGISGSSTRSVIYEEAKVPVENVLFTIGQGHVVALNALNVGRLKLAAHCVGTAKVALKHAARYALEREQFGQPIARYGMIQEKLARMATVVYVAESMLYRTAGSVASALAGCGEDDDIAKAGSITAHAVECAINKVFASEALDMVADETVQIFGGYGYSREYPADQIYRDARINRIFAGTNEINRLLVAKAILGSSAGDAAFAPAATGLAQDASPSQELRLVGAARKALRFALDKAIQAHGKSFEDQQELAARFADGAIQLHAMESALMRTLRVIELEGAEAAAHKLDMLRLHLNAATCRVRSLCTDALAALMDEGELRVQMKALDELLDFTPTNGIAIGRRVAARVLEAGGFTLH